MTIVIQHNSALGNTLSKAICDVNGNDNYFYASKKDLMLEIRYFSLLYAQFHLLIPYKFYVLGQIGLSKQCRPRSDCF